MARGFVLCADDYALTPGISKAIIALAERGRLSAISCMTNTPYWAEHAVWLKPLIGKVDIGLHITLVDEAPLAHMPRTAPDGKLPSIGALIVRSHLGLLDLAEIEAEVVAQFSAFESALGVGPSHVDGHLHTHVLPGIRDVILRRTVECSSLLWVRNIVEPLSNVLRRGVAVSKSLVLNTLGRTLADSPLHMNDGFTGVYSLGPNENYPALFEKFIDSDAPRLVVMCHPGSVTAEHVACAHARAKETAFLGSDDFVNLLARKGLRLSRFDDLAR